MHKRLLPWLICLITGIFVANFAFALETTLPADGIPAVTKTEKPGRIWNLQDADIVSIINEVSQETGVNFVIDPRVSGKVTLISSQPIKQNEVYQVFLSILNMLGYSAVPVGKVVKIIPNMESAEAVSHLVNKDHPGMGDEVVVRVIPLTNISASQLLPVLRPLLPQWSSIAVYSPGNAIIIVGHANNVASIYRIIQQVDKETSNGIELIPLQYATATQVALVLNNLQNASRAIGEVTVVSIGVDDRSNSILLSGPKQARLRFRVLIAKLDAPSSKPSGNTEVIYLRYQQAKSLAPLLAKVAANILGKGGATGTAEESASTEINPTNNNYASPPSGLNFGSPLNNHGSKSTTSVNISAPIVTNSTHIQADANTNAIIITAPPALMSALKEVIRKLDIRPAQVLVQAVIAQVDESNLTSLGIQWGSSASVSSSDGSSTSNNGPIATGTPTSFPNLGAGIVGIIPSTQIQAVLSVLQNQSGVDILSTPSIMVLDNQKALIEVGNDVPVQNGSYITTAGNVSPYNTTDYKKVTLKLEVTPQINLGKAVRLNLNLKNDTLQNPQTTSLTPLINTSNIANSVIVNSEDILVLGGLITNANNESINKVPILGDIPVIGGLFQQKTKNEQKKNLMVFLKPIILPSNDESMVISEMKYNTIRNMQANFRNDLTDIGKQPVPTRLPPWKNRRDLPKPFASEK